MEFNERVMPMLETPTAEQCLAMIKDFATTNDFNKLSPRHKEYIARLELYFMNQIQS